MNAKARRTELNNLGDRLHGFDVINTLKTIYRACLTSVNIIKLLYNKVKQLYNKIKQICLIKLNSCIIKLNSCLTLLTHVKQTGFPIFCKQFRRGATKNLNYKLKSTINL